MMYSTFKQLALMGLLAANCLGTAHGASSSASAAPLPKYQQECAACHIAYPPGMLPAASWQRLMGTLGKHYGADASLDEATTHEIGAWLKTQASTYKRVSEEPSQDRITKSAWFLRKHRAGEVPPEVWKRASVGSAANCSACHTHAAQGHFGERDIRIPK